MLAMTQSENSLSGGKVMLEHVVTVVLKKAKDSLLAKALARGGCNLQRMLSLTRKTMVL